MPVPMRLPIVLGLLALAAVAEAQSAAFSIRSDQVALGERVSIEVTLTNESDQSMDVRDIVPDGKELEVWVGLGPRRFSYQSAVEGMHSLHEIKPREKLQTTIEVPTVCAGEMSFELKAKGATFRKIVKVLPGPQGEDRVGVRMETSKGPLVLRLFPEAAPNTVLHFVDLVRQGFYNGLTFHRVIPGFMMQGGDPLGTGKGGPGFTLPAEFSKDAKYDHVAGRLAMARSSDPNSAGSQFYICFADAPSLNGTYTVFGEVVDGMDTVKAVEKVGSESGRTKEKVTITRAELRLYGEAH